jgi:hypothetical protein
VGGQWARPVCLRLPGCSTFERYWIKQIGVLPVRERAKVGSAAAKGDWPRRARSSARERPGRGGHWFGLNDRTLTREVLNLAVLCVGHEANKPAHTFLHNVLADPGGTGCLSINLAPRSNNIRYY